MKARIAISLLLFISGVCFSQQAPDYSVFSSYRDFSGGLDTDNSPLHLRDGYSPNLQDVIIDEPPNKLSKRNGYLHCGHMPSGLPVTALYEYSPIGQNRHLIVSDNSNFYQTDDCVVFSTIATGYSSSAIPRFATIQDKLWATNRANSVFTWNGSSVAYLNGNAIADAPRAQYITYWKGRVWMARTNDEPSGLYFSNVVDDSGNVIDQTVDTNTFTADGVIYINKDDGSPIYGIIVYRDNLLVFKDTGIWKVFFEDSLQVNVVQFVTATGTKFGDSAVESNGILYFLGNDGIYKYNGDSIEPISKQIDATVKTINQSDYSDIMRIWSTDSDFNAGTHDGTFADENEVSVSSHSVTDDTYADFASYTTISNVTIDSSGRLNLTYGEGIFNNSFDSGDTGWTHSPEIVISGGNATIPTDASYTVQLEIEKAGARLCTKAGALNYSTLTCGQSELQAAGALAGDTLKVRIASTLNGYNIWQDITYRGGPIAIGGHTTWTITPLAFYVVLENANGGGYAASGYYESKWFDMTVSSPTWGEIVTSEDIQTGTALTYQAEVSDTAAEQDAYVTATVGTGLALANRRWARYKVTMTQTKNNTPSLYSISLVAFSTGTYTSDYYQFTAGITYSGFAATENTATMPHQFYVRSSTSVPMLASATWDAVNPVQSLSISTNNIVIQWKVEYSTGTGTITPRLYSVNINGHTGTKLNKIGAIAYDNRYMLYVSTSGSYNNMVLMKSKFDLDTWTIFNYNVSGFALWNRILYGGVAGTDRVARFDYGTTDDGALICSYYDTKDEMYSYPSSSKYIQEIYVNYDGLSNSSFDVGVSTDNGASWNYITTTSSDTYPTIQGRRLFNTVGNTTVYRYRLRSCSAGKAFGIYGIDTFGYREKNRTDRQ